MTVDEVKVSRGPQGWVHSSLEVHNAVLGTSWVEKDLSGTIGAVRALILLKVENNAGADEIFAVRDGDETKDHGNTADRNMGCSGCTLQTGRLAYIMCETSASGTIDIVSPSNASGGTGVLITLIGYIKE